MRVRNEISLGTEGGVERAEDLEALREELNSLNKQIEHAERLALSASNSAARETMQGYGREVAWNRGVSSARTRG
jgi:hypothetical protein